MTNWLALANFAESPSDSPTSYIADAMEGRRAKKFLTDDLKSAINGVSLEYAKRIEAILGNIEKTGDTIDWDKSVAKMKNLIQQEPLYVGLHEEYLQLPAGGHVEAVKQKRFTSRIGTR